MEYDRTEEFNKMLTSARNMVKKFIYILNMNNKNRDDELIQKQLELIKYVRNNFGVVNFVIDKPDINSRETIKHNMGPLGPDLVEEYTYEIFKQDSRLYYKSSETGIYNIALKEDIDCHKNLNEIIVVGIDIYDFVIGLHSYLDEIDMDTKIIISSDASNVNNSYLNDLLIKNGISIIENKEYLNDSNNVYKLKR